MRMFRTCIYKTKFLFSFRRYMYPYMRFTQIFYPFFRKWGSFFAKFRFKKAFTRTIFSLPNFMFRKIYLKLFTTYHTLFYYAFHIRKIFMRAFPRTKFFLADFKMDWKSIKPLITYFTFNKFTLFYSWTFYCPTFYRTIFRNFYSIWKNIVFFFTILAYSLNHLYLQLKRPFSACSEATVKLLTHTWGRVLNTKNPSPLNKISIADYYLMSI
jgi:hypothetical protein